jgi:acetyl-CoA carboxylase biotin carboxyl carrier protein
MTEVTKLADILSQYGLTRLEYEKDGLRVVLERSASVAPSPAAPVSQVTLIAQDSDETSGTVVKAPLVGVVYSAREPGEAPYVRVGQSVKAGDTVCVIEAMKTFSEITAPCDGTVTEILFVNGQLAEFGAPLLTIG